MLAGEIKTGFVIEPARPEHDAELRALLRDTPMGDAMEQSQKSGSPSIRDGSYTTTPKSRSAALRLTFLSVVSLRWPMMSAQGTPISPAGNFFWRTPGITMLRGGT